MYIYTVYIQGRGGGGRGVGWEDKVGEEEGEIQRWEVGVEASSTIHGEEEDNGVGGGRSRYIK